MNKILRFSIPFILACLMLGVLFYLTGSSSQTLAAETSDPKSWVGRQLAVKQAQTQATLTVTTLEDELNGDGDCSLREAIEAANTNLLVDTCPAGHPINTDTITFGVEGTITMTSQLSVTDGGPLVIDGGEAITTSGGGMTRVWWVDTGGELILQNLGVVNGFINSDDGAGLYNSGNVSIINSIISSNHSDAYYGGGIFNTGFGRLVITSSTLSNNGAHEGGGISNWGTLTITNSTFSVNSADYFGGIQNGGTLTITNSYLPGNHAIQGGAIGNAGTMNITNSTLVANSAEDYGGGIINSGTLTITNSTLSENAAGINGGGINTWSKLEIINSTLSGNSAGGNGGGILADSGPWSNLVFNNVTIVSNTASSGGGIYNSSNTIFKNTIIAYNTSENCAGNIRVTSNGYNLDSGNSCEFSNTGDLINIDPLLGPLQDNGGSTLTHALLPNSPAIDAGDDHQCPPTDQRGVTRPLDGDGNGIAVCDIGSYEFEPGYLVVTTLEDELNVDGDCSLREAITAANDNTSVDECGVGSVITDTITFDVEGTITVTSQLAVTDGGLLVIDGGDVITTSGGGTTRVWWMEAGSEFTLQNLSVVNGSEGGLHNNYGNVSIIDAIFAHNERTGGGGGIINDGNMSISNSTIAENVIHSAFETCGGGGILNNGNLLIINSTISNNENDFCDYWSKGAGILDTSSGVLIIVNSTISGNSTEDGGEGGGIFSYGFITIVNSTISSNAASDGGGIYNWYTMTIINSTLSGNSATRYGGGIFNGANSIIVTNTIIANNILGDDCMIWNGNISDGGYNISSDDTCGFDPANGSMPNTDPLLGSLQNNGGPTWTHALLWDSPAIDTGDDAQCPPTDQRGIPRPLDGDEDGMAVCDIGSYEKEYQPVFPNLVFISGPNEAPPGPVIYFTATVEPISTTLPLTYTWQADGQQTIIHTNGLTDIVSFTWEMPGTYAITVTASNLVGSISDTHLITIVSPVREIFLPLVIKSSEAPLGSIHTQLVR